jgi:hypothetical protein
MVQAAKWASLDPRMAHMTRSGQSEPVLKNVRFQFSFSDQLKGICVSESPR